MAARRVTATEFSRNLSTLLSEVRYRHASLEITRGKAVIARVLPPPEPVGFPIDRLNRLFASLPALDAEDAADSLNDLDNLDKTLGERLDPRD
jgi:hypothetical protein